MSLEWTAESGQMRAQDPTPIDPTPIRTTARSEEAAARAEADRLEKKLSAVLIIWTVAALGGIRHVLRYVGVGLQRVLGNSAELGEGKVVPVVANRCSAPSWVALEGADMDVFLHSFPPLQQHSSPPSQQLWSQLMTRPS